ncbi:BDR-repeat family protein [Borrelia duttonii CR2A]|uniref:BDR-repeat family protein n=1 Tax=Borrelia duttonii CR2A TaxID=1432657 RepID=W6TK33_9SPIR|nr:BDR-repeat family protein [Borrelia duttonii CR2A]
MVLNELVKAGINREIADDLSYRYYKNELTYKDIEYIKENFDIKLKHLEEKIFDIKEELISRIDNKFIELDNTIDTKFNELDNKINIIENNLNIKN